MTYDHWTSRKRVETALDHREPDRVPFDLGSSKVTGIHANAYRRLRQYLGLSEMKTELLDVAQQLARVHPDVLDRLEVDVYGVMPRPARSFTLPHWTEDGYDKIRDEWGIEWWRPVDGGLYYDMRLHPLADIESAADLAKFHFPDPLDPGRFEGLADRARHLLNERRVACILSRHCPGLLEISIWLRGYEDFYTDLLANRPLAEAILDRVLELKMQYWEKVLELVGPDVMICAEADDLAGQDGPLMSPGLYRELIKPRHTRLFSFIRQCAAREVKIFFHSCGSVASIIPDLIESGVDILNPVQVSARGMDTRELKRLYGRDISFHGAGVDTQAVLPGGTPQEVRDEVRRRIDDLAPGGGFIFNTVHNIQVDVPPENIMAMWEALHEFGVYS
jgi:uroporphyrinogen decarboxylase